MALNERHQLFLTQLRHLLTDLFDEDELRSLCFDLGIVYADLPGTIYSIKVIELIGLMQRSNRLAELVELSSNLRPKADWPPLPADFEMADFDQSFLIKLRQLLTRHFSKPELHELIFDLGIEYDTNLAEQGRVAISHALVLWAVEPQTWQTRLPKLLALVQQKRPSVTWPTIPEDFVPPKPPRSKLFWAGITVAGIFIIASIIGVWFLFNPLPMSPGFNVAVAQVDTADSAISGSNLSSSIYNAVHTHNRQLADSYISKLRRPFFTGAVLGNDPETRHAHAAQLAAEQNITVLIYGAIISDDQISLELYINEEAFDDKREVTELKRLGLPIPFTPDEPLEENEMLNGRFEALPHVISGLSNLFFGRNLDAWDDFKQATQIETWSQTDGKEDVFLLMATAKPMDEGVNVAVAEFAMVDEFGNISESTAGQELSNWLYDNLDDQIAQLTEVAHLDTRGPDEIGLVYAETAAKVAHHHNANILIYGFVEEVEGQHQVSLKFYVNDVAFGYGSEVAGPERLGQAVPYTPPLTPVSLTTVNQSLNGRSAALQLIVTGLSKFYLGLYEPAWADFWQAAHQSGWEQDTGKEVVHLLMGAARLRLYDPLTAPDELEKAAAEFAQARTLNNQYGRSYLGLGIIALEQAKIISGTKIIAVDPHKLATAKGLFQRSLEVSDQPEQAYIQAKAQFGLGQTYLLEYDTKLDNASAQETQDAYTEVLNLYNAVGQPASLELLAAHTHAQLGLLAYHRQDWQTSIIAYSEAIGMLNALPNNIGQNWVARYWYQISLSELSRNQYSNAHSTLQTAIRIAQEHSKLVSPEELAEWEEILATLEEES